MRYAPHILVTLLLGAAMYVAPRWADEHPVHQRRADVLANVERLRGEIDTLRDQNQRLYRQVQTFSTDALSIEQRARDEFLYVYPDEIILDFSPNGADDHGTEASQTASAD
jgi:hypothetical protein